MKNTGFDTHRSFNSSKYHHSRPTNHNHDEFANSSSRADIAYQKLQKLLPSTHKTSHKKYDGFNSISSTALYSSKCSKSKNHKNVDKRSFAKNSNSSLKKVPKGELPSSLYKGIIKSKYSLDVQTGAQLEQSGLSVPQSLLYHSNVSECKQAYKSREKLEANYSKHRGSFNDIPSDRSIHDPRGSYKKPEFDGQRPDCHEDVPLCKSSFNEVPRYNGYDSRLKQKLLALDRHYDKRMFDLGKNSNRHTKQKLFDYPKIESIKTDRSHYETGFLKKEDDFQVRPRKLTNHLEYSQPYQNNSLVPKLEKLADLKYDISALSTRHPSLHFPSERKISLKEFYVGKCLGHGRFGKVYQAIHRATGFVVALKKITKDTIKAHKLENQLALEIKIQMCVSHPNIVKMYGIINERESIYMILEHMEQGSLFEQLKKRGKLLSEKEVAQIVKEIVSAIRYLHDLSVVHRDIKLENILISNGVCKLADFGWATFSNERRKTNCGTLDYCAPEILEGQGYDQSIDLWCIGVLTFQLLTGKVPFYHASKKETVNKIMKVEMMDFPSRVSEDARRFTEALLVKQPSHRLNVDRMLGHPFIANNCE